MAVPIVWSSRPHIGMGSRTEPSNVLTSAELGKVKAASEEGPRRHAQRSGLVKGSL